MNYCWQCGAEWTGKGQPACQAVCEACREDLHVCRNCINYDTHAASQCRERCIEPVINKERFNYCEEFQFLNASRPPTPSVKKPAQNARAQWDNLFKKH